MKTIKKLELVEVLTSEELNKLRAGALEEACKKGCKAGCTEGCKEGHKGKTESEKLKMN